MNNAVYIAVKAPLNNPIDPHLCRIGISNGTQIIDGGWVLYSSVSTNNSEDSEAIRAHILKLLQGAIYDAENKAWFLPPEVIDYWMREKADDFRR